MDNLTGCLSIGIHAGADKDCLGAKRTSLGRRHGRVDPEPPYLTAASSNDAPAIGGATDDQRLTAELRSVALLDRRKEGTHIHMDDLAETDRIRQDWTWQSITSSPDLMSVSDGAQRERLQAKDLRGK